jgi:hypothetical protein
LSSAAFPARPLRRGQGPWLYAAAAVVALFELGVTWLALHPDVPADYRAYYLDQTTTCLNEPVNGSYSFGTEVTFRSSPDDRLIKPLRVCGWEGPVGDGLHAVGESARLRFALPYNAQNLTLMLEMVAVDMAGPKGQRVVVRVNGSNVGEVRAVPKTPRRFDFTIPNALLAAGHRLDIELSFPDAIRIDPQDSDTRKRSIKLLAGKVV